jgi:hypothetical protein
MIGRRVYSILLAALTNKSLPSLDDAFDWVSSASRLRSASVFGYRPEKTFKYGKSTFSFPRYKPRGLLCRARILRAILLRLGYLCYHLDSLLLAFCIRLDIYYSHDTERSALYYSLIVFYHQAHEH